MNGERKIPTRILTPSANQLEPTFFRSAICSSFFITIKLSGLDARSSCARSERRERPGRARPASRATWRVVSWWVQAPANARESRAPAPTCRREETFSLPPARTWPASDANALATVGEIADSIAKPGPASSTIALPRRGGQGSYPGYRAASVGEARLASDRKSWRLDGRCAATDRDPPSNGSPRRTNPRLRRVFGGPPFRK